MHITRSTVRKRIYGVTDDQSKLHSKSRRRGKNNRLSTSLETALKVEAGTNPLNSGKSPDLQDQFEYQPLNSYKNEIRLLQISPVRKYDGVSCGIECDIHHASLSDVPDYDALSYVWGDRNNLRSILLEGCSFFVTANLHNALLRLRSSPARRPIWIDAISINQDDLRERSEQVVKMGDIFKQAAKVVTWLGDADSQSELTFSLLRKLKDNLRDRNSVIKILNGPNSVKFLYGLYRLFYREYWWRVWVIQEVTFAKTIEILCGADSFLWSDLVSIQETLAVNHLRDLDVIAHDRPELSFLRVSIESRGPRAMRPAMGRGTMDLTQILLQHRFKDSSDPKDMIYSLVGLSNAHKDPRFVVDYSKSVCQVYTDVVEFVLTTTNRLDIICAMPRGINVHELPSWVPDWSFHGIGSSLLEHCSKHQFSAAGTSDAIAKISDDKTTIQATGILLGTISTVGAACDMDDLEDIRHATAAFQGWQKQITLVTGNSAALAEAFCRNILQEKYPVDQVRIWTQKSDFPDWIIGAFVDAMILFCNDIELDPSLAKFKGYGTAWQFLEDDHVMGMILLKGAAEMMFGRRIFILDNGLLGLGPETLAIGDTLLIVLGCQLPVVLRPGKSQYVYLGEAFVNGYMFGKIMDDLDIGVHKLETFDIH